MIKLSIFVVTYNQEDYIEECLDSIARQHIDVSYEILIGEDCSYDKTPEICDRFANSHENVTVYHHKENLGLLKNWEFVLNHCKGEYVALIEGDDIWADSYKLKKQISFLDQNKQHSAVFSRANLLYMPGSVKGAEILLPNLEERDYTIREMASQFIILSSSIMFRKEPILPIHFSDQLLYADIYTFLLLFRAGKVHCLGEQLTSYRIHDKNLSRIGDSSFFVASFKMCRYYIKNFPEVRDIYKKRLDAVVPHIMYDRSIGAWKYRLYWIYRNPKLLLSRFAIKTIKSYIFNF